MRDIEVIEEYLKPTECIDFENPLIIKQSQMLSRESKDIVDYIKRAYTFVRDEITHSWDAGETIVSITASDVLKNGTGICWTKSCLLAALLRANHIPAGISYQRLTRADEDARDGYIIHALNTIYIEEIGKWIRLDARGNKSTVHAEFNITKEILAFPIREEFGECDYHDNYPDLDARLVAILKESENVLNIHADIIL